MRTSYLTLCNLFVTEAHLFTDEHTIIHGLETLIEYYQEAAHGLVSKLTKVCKKDPPPHDSRRHGRTNLLHRATKEGNYVRVSTVILFFS